MNDIPQDLVDQVLADPKAREMITQLLKANNIEQSIDELPDDIKKQAVAALLNAQRQQQPQPASDEMLDQVLADPAAVTQINAMLTANNMPTTFPEMDRESQKALLGQILAQQQQRQQENAIQVDLQAMGVEKEAFDKIWNDAQQEAQGDVGKLASLLQAKLFAAGAPAGAISQLIDQLPKPPPAN